MSGFKRNLYRSTAVTVVRWAENLMVKVVPYFVCSFCDMGWPWGMARVVGSKVSCNRGPCMSFADHHGLQIQRATDLAEVRAR